MSIFQDISSRVSQLLGSPGIEVKFHKNSLVPESEIDGLIETLSSIFEIKCPPTIAASVEIDDHLNAYWKGETDSGDEAVFGEFFLRSVLLFDAENEIDPALRSKTYNGIDLDKTRVFDYYAYNGGPIYALFPVADGEIEDRVLIFNERQVFQTRLSYSTYLELVNRTRGFLFWQYLFCEDVHLEAYEIAAIRRGLGFLEQRFPGEEYSDLKIRLEAIDRQR